MILLKPSVLFLILLAVTGGCGATPDGEPPVTAVHRDNNSGAGSAAAKSGQERRVAKVPKTRDTTQVTLALRVPAPTIAESIRPGAGFRPSAKPAGHDAGPAYPRPQESEPIRPVNTLLIVIEAGKDGRISSGMFGDELIRFDGQPGAGEKALLDRIAKALEPCFAGEYASFEQVLFRLTPTLRYEAIVNLLQSLVDRKPAGGTMPCLSLACQSYSTGKDGKAWRVRGSRSDAEKPMHDALVLDIRPDEPTRPGARDGIAFRSRKDFNDVHAWIETVSQGIAATPALPGTTADKRRPLAVVLGAGRDAPFEIIEVVLRACHASGYRTFTLRATDDLVSAER